MQAVLFSAAMAAAMLGCQAPSAPVTTTALLADRHHAEVRRHRGPLPKDQLARVKRATARYRDVNKALADGYTDINVVLPNMGRHFLKTPILDAAFEVEQPELLDRPYRRCKVSRTTPRPRSTTTRIFRDNRKVDVNARE